MLKYMFLFVFFSQGVLANQAQEYLLSLSDLEQKQVFSGLMRDNAYVCDAVDSLFYHRMNLNNSAYWYLACTNHKGNRETYEVLVRDDETGSTHITSCSALEQVGLSCFWSKDSKTNN